MTDQPTDWQPLVQVPSITTFDMDYIQEVMEHYGLDWDAARAWLHRSQINSQFYRNNMYQVEVSAWGPNDSCLRITIQRRDGLAVRDWRHFQQIKNELAGEEREAVELYPAESRKIDTSNKWHLWVSPEGSQFGLGWTQRDVRHEASDTPGLQQRAL